MAGCSLKPERRIVDSIVNCYEKSFIDSRSDSGLLKVKNLSLLQSTDVLTKISAVPEVDAEIIFNHCISDIYAAGGNPIAISAITGLVRGCGDLEYYKRFACEISKISSKIGVNVTGGHTIYVDRETLLGFSVIGLKEDVYPNENSIQSPGDMIFTTKPIGTGFIFQDELWLDNIGPEDLRMICSSNYVGAELFQFATSVTDVSGYGLAGHLMNCLSNGNIAILDGDAIPVYNNADLSLPSKQTLNNFLEFSLKVISHKRFNFIYDNQTNGGLIFTVRESKIKAVNEFFFSRGLPLFKIGYIDKSSKSSVAKVFVK